MTPHPELPRHIDSTMISCHRSCPQKFYKEFVLGLRPTGLSVDLHAGACFATAVETVGRSVFQHGNTIDRAIGHGLAAFLNAWGDFVPMKETPKSKERVWAAVEEYFRCYPPLTDHVQPFLVDGKPTYEWTFAVPLEPTCQTESDGGFPLHPSGEPFLYSGRLDRLGTWSGKIVGQDEKTTTSIGQSWADNWRLRSQFMGYCWALQQHGLDVDTMVVRGIGILKTKITVVEAMTTFSDWLIARWLGQLRRDLWRIRRAWDEGYFDFNLADACTSYGGCAFNGLCGNPNEENWYGNYTIRRWNPLQKNPIEIAA